MPEQPIGGLQSSQINVIQQQQVDGDNSANQQINSAALNNRDVQQVANDAESLSLSEKFSNACSACKDSFVAMMKSAGDGISNWCAQALIDISQAGSAFKEAAGAMIDAAINKFSSNNNGLSISDINVQAGVNIVIDQNDQPGADMGPGAAASAAASAAANDPASSPVNVPVDAQVMEMELAQNQIQANIEQMMAQNNDNNDVDIVANGPQLVREGSQEGVPDDIGLGNTAGFIDDVVNNMLPSEQRQMAIDENIAQQAQAAYNFEGMGTDMGEQAAREMANMPTNFAQNEGEGAGAGAGAGVEVDAGVNADVEVNDEVGVEALRQESLAARGNEFSDEIQNVLKAEDIIMDDIVADMAANNNEPIETDGNDKVGE